MGVREEVLLPSAYHVGAEVVLRSDLVELLRTFQNRQDDLRLVLGTVLFLGHEHYLQLLMGIVSHSQNFRPWSKFWGPL